MKKNMKKVVIFGHPGPHFEEGILRYRAAGNSVVSVDINRFKDSPAEYIPCDAVILMHRRDMIKECYPRLAEARGDAIPEFVEHYEGAIAPEPEKAQEPEPQPENNEAPSQDDELNVLRAEAESLGLTVDKRWSAATLREKIDTALEA